SPIKLPRCLLWLHTQLASQQVDTNLVLMESRGPPPLARVEAHERAMRHFLEGIEAEQAQRGLNGPLRSLKLHLVSEQLGHRLGGEFVQALALGAQPLLELG